jgi:hypothetical protein
MLRFLVNKTRWPGSMSAHVTSACTAVATAAKSAACSRCNTILSGTIELLQMEPAGPGKE